MKYPGFSVALLLLALSVHSRLLVGKDTQAKENDEVDRSIRNTNGAIHHGEEQLFIKLVKRLRINGEDPTSVGLTKDLFTDNSFPTKKNSRSKVDRGDRPLPPVPVSDHKPPIPLPRNNLPPITHPPPIPTPRNFHHKNVSQPTAVCSTAKNQNSALPDPRNHQSRHNQTMTGPFPLHSNASVKEVPTVQDLQNGDQIIRLIHGLTQWLNKEKKVINQLVKSQRNGQDQQKMEKIIIKAYKLSVEVSSQQRKVQKDINGTSYSSLCYRNYIYSEGNDFWLKCQDIKHQMKQVIKDCLSKVKKFGAQKPKGNGDRGRSFTISDPTNSQHIGGFELLDSRRPLKSDGGSPSPQHADSHLYGIGHRHHKGNQNGKHIGKGHNEDVEVKLGGKGKDESDSSPFGSKQHSKGNNDRKSRRHRNRPSVSLI